MDLKIQDLEKLIGLQNQEIAKLEASVAQFKNIIEKANTLNSQLQRENHAHHEMLRKLNGRLIIALENGVELVKDYPDIWLHTNRWKQRRFVSESVNSAVTEVTICHNCGCCSDSPLEVWPYLEHEGTKIFSDPPVFTVGERWDYGDRPYENWEESLRKAKISEAVIEKIKVYFEDNSSDEEEESE